MNKSQQVLVIKSRFAFWKKTTPLFAFYSLAKTNFPSGSNAAFQHLLIQEFIEFRCQTNHTELQSAIFAAVKIDTDARPAESGWFFHRINLAIPLYCAAHTNKKTLLPMQIRNTAAFKKICCTALRVNYLFTPRQSLHSYTDAEKF